MQTLRHIIPFVIAATVTAHAGELTLEMKPFFITHSFPATILPEQSLPIRLDAGKWKEFEIVSLADHGSIVKKDQPLITFDPVEIEKKLADARHAIATETLELTQARQELAILDETVPGKLARLKRGAEEAAEELQYFTTIRRKSMEESAGFELKRSKQILASYQEELKQLLKMYEADDLTEETEEIILQKQRDSVESAEFALRMEMLDHKRTLEIKLPREATRVTEARDDTALEYEKASKELPRSIELKQLAIKTLETSLARNKESLAELEKDRGLFEIKAPGDGLFYYGSIEDGKWTTGDLIKSLAPEGQAPVGKVFATFIPTTSTLALHAFLDEATARVLSAGTKGTANLPGREDLPIPVALKSISPTPNPDLTQSAIFTPEWPEGIKPAPGQKLEIHLISYAAENTLSVPTKALAYGPKGWTVEVKLADGKTEHRPVTRGLSSAEETEITAGLEPGQVIVAP